MMLSFRIGAGMGTEVHLLAQQAVFLYVGYAPPPLAMIKYAPRST